VPEIAGQHHEKMRGGGYPNGVPAGETPLGSRLMAVADVFDSLTASDRPYKPAIPLERALKILQAMADEGDLDPDVVKLFIDTEIWVKLKLKLVRLADATDEQKAAR
jgi:HD-GYP domain-containing protein (c-di-GMP phosphodiesterase class II)